MSEAGPVLYDVVELRGRIAVSFSVGELKDLADSLGVGGVAWERGIHEAAREVVRQCERYAGLPALVAKLREVRPLVEWPEPAPAPPGGFAPPALSASPGSLAPLADPYAPPPGPPAIHAPPPVAPVATAAPVRAGWPGVGGEPAAPPRGGLDPRILLGVGGLMVAAAIIAYFAGRASTAAVPPGASPAASATAGAAEAAHAGGPAALAAETLARSFANLARVCELPTSAGTSALVIRRVFERCGPGAPPHRPYSPPPPIATAEASAQPAPPSDAAPAHGRRPGRGGDSAPSEAPGATKGCAGACAAQHDACQSGCGPEPTESSAYDGYQRCLGRCLSAESRCKLTCR